MKKMELWVPSDLEVAPVVIEIGSTPKGPGDVFAVKARSANQCRAFVARYVEQEAKGLPKEPASLELLKGTHPHLFAVKRIARYTLVTEDEPVEMHAPWGQTKTVKRPVTRLVKE